jgi:hypothetical protein
LVDETEQLRALMEADRWIDRVGAQREHLVEMAELSALEGDLRGFAKDLQEAKAAQTPVRSAYEAAQHDTERLSLALVTSRNDSRRSTANARELAAIHTELEHVRQLLSSAEDIELGLLIDVEPLDEAVSAIKAHAQPGLARRGELQATIAQLQSTLDEEITSLRVARVARADALSPDLLKRYQGVMSRVGPRGCRRLRPDAATGAASRCRRLTSTAGRPRRPGRSWPVPNAVGCCCRDHSRSPRTDHDQRRKTAGGSQ